MGVRRLGGRALLVVGIGGLSLLPSCDGDAPGTGGATASSSASTTASSSTGKFSTVASSTSSAGGAGPCLPGDPSEGYFTYLFELPDTCFVARYEVPELDLDAPEKTPSWGAHGGPLTAVASQTGANADLTIARWSLSGSSLAKTESTVSLGPVPMPAMFSPQILDTPLGNNFVAWRGADELVDGGVFFTTDATQVSAHKALGVRSAGFVGGASGGDVRLLYTGRSALDGADENAPALYAADFHADGTLAAPSFAISAWGDPGPVAIDSAGNVIAAQGGEMRGFKASEVQPGAPPALGKTFWNQFAVDELAITAPTATAPGYALFQDKTFHNSLMIQGYKVGLLFAKTESFVLAQHDDGHPLKLLTDTSGRIWIGYPNPSGVGTVFLVYDRH